MRGERLPARMHLAGDHVQPTRRRGRCRIRIFMPSEEGERLGDRPEVICSEVEGNPGAGITEAAESIRASVVGAFRLGDNMWIEHRPVATTGGRTETFELVVLEGLGGPSRKPLDRASVGGRERATAGGPGSHARIARNSCVVSCTKGEWIKRASLGNGRAPKGSRLREVR